MPVAMFPDAIGINRKRSMSLDRVAGCPRSVRFDRYQLCTSRSGFQFRVIHQQRINQTIAKSNLMLTCPQRECARETERERERERERGIETREIEIFALYG